MSADQGSAESHGVYGGTQRGDGKMQEEPDDADPSSAGADASVANGVDASVANGVDASVANGVDEQEWAEQTETGGDAT